MSNAQEPAPQFPLTMLGCAPMWRALLNGLARNTATKGLCVISHGHVPASDSRLSLKQAVIAAARSLEADQSASCAGRPVARHPCIEEQGSV